MTLKGKKNHYNVKLLRGYGVSINLKDNRVILKDGQNDISGKSETEGYFYKINNKHCVKKCKDIELTMRDFRHE